MGKYLVIESRDPFDSGDVANVYDLTKGLAEQNEVTLFLVQNGVLPARKASKAASQLGALGSGVTVLADEFSLQERGITDDELADGVKPTPIDDLVDLMMDGRKVFWH